MSKRIHDLGMPYANPLEIIRNEYYHVTGVVFTHDVKTCPKCQKGVTVNKFDLYLDFPRHHLHTFQVRFDKNHDTQRFTFPEIQLVASREKTIDAIMENDRICRNTIYVQFIGWEEEV